MAQYSEMLGAVNLRDIQLGNAVHHDYFYIPVFKHLHYDEDYQSETLTLELEMGDGIFDSKGYASRVTKGETLWQAIKNDLQKDFDYTVSNWQEDWFKVLSIKSFDSIDDQEGKPLDRFLVYVLIARKLDTTNIKPLGLSCRWSPLD